MGILIDEYRRNWAIRFLREAESDLLTAEETLTPSISDNLAVLAMRKMQMAIYYSLGDPSYMAALVEDALGEGGKENTLIRFLIRLEWLIQIRSVKSSVTDREALNEAKLLMSIALKIVKGIIGERTFKGFKGRL